MRRPSFAGAAGYARWNAPRAGANISFQARGFDLIVPTMYKKSTYCINCSGHTEKRVSGAASICITPSC